MQKPILGHRAAAFFGGAMAFLRRRFASLRVCAVRCRARHNGPVGLLLAAVCSLAALFYRGWMAILTLLERVERRGYRNLRALQRNLLQI